MHTAHIGDFINDLFKNSKFCRHSLLKQIDSSAIFFYMMSFMNSILSQANKK